MAVSQIRAIMNPLCEVYFEGFLSNTYKLGGAGWDISFENEYAGSRDSPDYKMRITRIILFNKKLRMTMIGSCREFHVAEWRCRGEHQDQLPSFRINQAANDIILRYQADTLPLGNSYWCETAPVYTTFKEHSIYEIPLFQEKHKPAQEGSIIVEPRDVAEMLEQIKKMQAPNQAEIRKRNRESFPMLHATILSYGT